MSKRTDLEQRVTDLEDEIAKLKRSLEAALDIKPALDRVDRFVKSAEQRLDTLATTFGERLHKLETEAAGFASKFMGFFTKPSPHIVPAAASVPDVTIAPGTTPPGFEAGKPADGATEA